MNPSIWDRLGIPAGSDKAAIRRAYARLVRTTHPEDDPEGFQALRASYEQALYWADRPLPDPAEPWAPETADELEELAAEGDFAPAAPPGRPWRDLGGPAPAPASEPARPERARHAAALRQLEQLLRDPEIPAEKTLNVALEAVLESPAMDEIDCHAATERHLAYLLAGAIPRSDCLIERTARFFDWKREDYAARRNWDVDAVLRRFDDWDELLRLGDPAHPAHRAWQALSDPAPPGWKLRLQALSPQLEAEVIRLLDAIQYDWTGLAHHLNPARTAWWTAHLARARINLDTLLLAPFAAAVLLVAAELLAGWGPGPLLLAAVAAISLPLPYLYLVTVKQLHARWARGEAEPPRRLTDEWAVAAAALLPLGALVSGFPVGAVLIAALAAALAFWVSIAVPPRLADQGWPARIGALFALAWPLAIMTGLLRQAATPAHYGAFCALSMAYGFIWWRAGPVMSEWVSSLLRGSRQLVILGLAAAVAGIGYAVGELLSVPTGAAIVGFGSLGIWLLARAAWAIEPNENKFGLVVAWLIMAGTLMEMGSPRDGRDYGEAGAPTSSVPARAATDRGGAFETEDVGVAGGEAGARDPLYPWPDEAGNGEAARPLPPVAAPPPAAAVPAPPPPPPPPPPVRCPADAATQLPRPPQPCMAHRWIVEGHYPAEAMRRRETGTTATLLEIDETGRVAGCEVSASSGSATLDAATCRLLRQRARFLPARDADDAATGGRFIFRMRWELEP